MTISPVFTDHASTAQEIRHSRLASASEEFEAMLLSQMLKPLHFGDGPDEAGQDTEGGGSADTIRGMGTEALGKALAQHGGLGLARKILREVTTEGEAVDARRGVLKSQ